MIRQKKKNKNIWILFFVISLISCLFVSLVKAETEPNDSFAQAEEVPVGGDIIGLTAPDDPDFYKICCVADSWIIITWPGGSVGNELVIRIYDPNFDEIDSVHFPQIENSIEVHAQISGWYYIEVIEEDINGLFGVVYFLEVTYTHYAVLEWVEPDSGDIEFGVSTDNAHALFNITYSSIAMQKVELWLNGQNYGEIESGTSPISKTITIPYSAAIDGEVSAELKGYRFGVVFLVAQRDFNFSKVVQVDYDVLNSGNEFVGNKLYSILYDPNGDYSYSGWKEGTTFAMGVGASISIGIGLSVGVEADFLLFEGEANLEYKVTMESGFDFKYETTELTKITSGQRGYDPDGMGPGFGDYFWGEVWLIPWKFMAVHKVFWSGEEIWIDPMLYYGVERTATALVIASQAPQEWLDLSLYPDYPNENVYWIDTQVVSGGGGEKFSSEEIVTTIAVHHSITIDIGASASVKIGAVTTELTLDLQTKVYNEVSTIYTIERYYSLMDDDVGDTIVNDVGYDKRFGTFVFRTVQGACRTSNPLEHNTVDYLFPIVYTPVIDYDSSGDGLAPCVDDEPIVNVELEDEGGIKEAWLEYSINNGVNWNREDLTEQVANPGFWQGQLPSYEHGTDVLWFVVAKDNADQITEKKDANGDPFSYTVLNSPPDIDLVSPEGGESFTGNEIQIDWTCTDQDNDDLTFSIAYNFNNQGWQSLVEGLTEETYLWDISAIENTENVLIRVTAHDSFGGDASDTIEFTFSINRSATVENSLYLPSLVILSVLALVLSVRVIRKRR